MQVYWACGVQVNSSGVVSARVLRQRNQEDRGISPSLRAREDQFTVMEEREFSLLVPSVLRTCSVNWMIATHMRSRERGMLAHDRRGAYSK